MTTIAILIPGILLVIGFLVIYYLLSTRDVRRHKVSFMEGLDLTGLPIVTFRNNGHKFNFVLDTGSCNSVINKSVLDRLDHVKSPHKAYLVGIDGIKRDGQEIIQAEIQYKDKSIHANFIVSDLDDIFKEIKAETGVQLHGLLGSTFFKENKYIINYDELVAYSKKI